MLINPNSHSLLGKNFFALAFLSKAGFASKMQAGSTQKTKDSAGRRLGVKKFGGEEAFPNDVLARQRGLKWHPGANTVVGLDHTIHAKVEGKVRFEKDRWRKRGFYYIHVDPNENPNRTRRPPPPFVYHPELFPELAKYNPQPTNFMAKYAKDESIKEDNKQKCSQKVESSKYFKPINPFGFVGNTVSEEKLPEHVQLDPYMEGLEKKYLEA